MSMSFVTKGTSGRLKSYLSSLCSIAATAAPTKPVIRFQSTTIATVGSSLQSAAADLFDIKLVESRVDLVASHLDARCSGAASHSLARLVELSKLRSGLILERDAARGKRKMLSGQIGILLKDRSQNFAEQVAELKQAVHDAADTAAALDETRNIIEMEMRDMYESLPNLLDDRYVCRLIIVAPCTDVVELIRRVPLGEDETSNVVVSSWGDDLIKRDETEYLAYAHDDIAHRMGNILSEPAVLMAGTRFSILTGHLARLERALIQYFLDFHSSRGYDEISTPYIVSASTLKGTGQLPKFKDDLFLLSNHKVGVDEDSYLIPTAEVPVLGTYRNQILSKSDLPIRHVCYSPCFRAEGGSAGRDTRGLIRQHQFHKVELIKICSPESAEEEHIAMVKDVEDVLVSLGLPHRRVLLCSGDTGRV